MVGQHPYLSSHKKVAGLKFVLRYSLYLCTHFLVFRYQWNESVGQWKWTPEADGSIWMPCATKVVSVGFHYV